MCLQELFRSQYFCQKEDTALFALAEPIPGPSTQAIAAAARKHKVVVVASLFERRAAGLYHNTAVVFDRDGSIVGTYRKMHIPDDPLYYEKFYFTPGDLGFKVHDTSAGRMGVLVCWDQWFPEGARLTALQGAEILFYPTAIGWLPSESREMNLAQHSAWETIQRAHAIANGVFVAAVNRVGREGELTFWGQSFVADPVRPHHRQGVDRPGGDPARADRSREDRGDAAELAVPARPPHRRLRRPRLATARRAGDRAAMSRPTPAALGYAMPRRVASARRHLAVVAQGSADLAGSRAAGRDDLPAHDRGAGRARDASTCSSTTRRRATRCGRGCRGRRRGRCSCT